MKNRRPLPIWFPALASTLLLLGASGAAQTFNFVEVDVPSSAPFNAIATIANGINSSGDIVGTYVENGTLLEHGYLLRDGNFTSINVPGDLVGVAGVLQTEVNGINDKGDIVGDYFATPGAPGAPQCDKWVNGSPTPECIRGFLYSDGKFSDVLVPGHAGSIPNSITVRGTIYGCLHDYNLMGSMYGFARLRGRADGEDDEDSAEFRFITLMASGGELADPTLDIGVSMNNGGTPDGKVIVGLHTDMMTKHTHGYTVQNGEFQLYDVPGSLATTIWGINPTRAFVGFFVSADGKRHGFLQHWRPSAPVTIDYPGAIRTSASAINPAGAIVGAFRDTAGSAHGFLAVPASDDGGDSDQK